MNEIEYDALGTSENEITREILHKMLDEMLTKIENKHSKTRKSLFK